MGNAQTFNASFHLRGDYYLEIDIEKVLRKSLLIVLHGLLIVLFLQFESSVHKMCINTQYHKQLKQFA